MSVAILFDYTAMDDFRDGLNEFCRAHPEQAGHIRDCILTCLMPASVTAKSDNWPDIRVSVAPTDDLVTAIRRRVGPDIVPWLPRSSIDQERSDGPSSGELRAVRELLTRYVAN